jgi:hypothetical protein
MYVIPLMAHNDQVIAPANRSVGRRIEQRGAVVLADCHPNFAPKLQFLNSVRGRCATSPRPFHIYLP